MQDDVRKAAAVAELDRLAKAHARAGSPPPTFEQAYDAVLRTREGQELYERTV